MDFSTYPWTDGSFSIGDPTTSYLDPTLSGQFGYSPLRAPDRSMRAPAAHAR